MGVCREENERGFGIDKEVDVFDLSDGAFVPGQMPVKARSLKARMLQAHDPTIRSSTSNHIL